MNLDLRSLPVIDQPVASYNSLFLYSFDQIKANTTLLSLIFRRSVHWANQNSNQKRATGSWGGKSYIGHKTWLVEKTATSLWLVNARRTRFLNYYIEFAKNTATKKSNQKTWRTRNTRVVRLRRVSNPRKGWCNRKTDVIRCYYRSVTTLLWALYKL